MLLLHGNKGILEDRTPQVSFLYSLTFNISPIRAWKIRKLLQANMSVADIEMRLGYLGRLSDLPLNGQMLGSHPGIPSDLHRTGHPVGGMFTARFITMSIVN